jgi:SNF2 family DNA or RNA helicase
LQAVLSNWRAEFDKWTPGINAIMYDGTPDERKVIRVYNWGWGWGLEGEGLLA